MGRPTNPDWTVVPFSTDANYAAGAETWSGQPTKVIHPGPAGGFVPNQGAAAEYFNYYYNKAFDHDGDAKTKLDELVTYVGQLQATNVGPAYGFDIGVNLEFGRFAFFNEALKTWHVCANGYTLYESATPVTLIDSAGAVVPDFVSNATLNGLGASGEDCLGGCADTDGNMVICTDTRYVFEGSGASWTKVDAFAAAITGVASSVVYAPGPDLWCAFLIDAGIVRVRTSSNRTAWTNRTGPGGFGPGPVRLVCNTATGRIVAVNQVTGADAVYYDWSTDGGITWDNTTASFPFMSTGTGFDSLYLAYNPDLDQYLCTTGLASGTPGASNGEVWSSTDGGDTFTKISTQDDWCVLNPAPFGSMWIAVATNHFVEGNYMVYSLDGGVTWKLTDVLIHTDAVGAFAGAGRLLVLSAYFAYRGMATGEPGLGSLT
jgi:hypothetical protein